MHQRTDPQQPPVSASFLAAEGEMASRIRSHPWQDTPLGPPGQWPPGLKAMVRLALTTLHPVVIFWGGEHLCLYNDAYSVSLGPEKHPAALGRPGRDAWPEAWPTIAPQIASALRGDGPSWHENQLVPTVRHGRLQDLYWTCSYGPIHDESAPNGVGGVLAIFNETTPQVLAERALACERERLAQLFARSPSFMALLSGPEHVIEFANPAYLALVGHRPVLGLPVARALPDAVEQGYVALLDRVYASGKAFTASGLKYAYRRAQDDAEVERFVDFVYQPVRDAGGFVTGIFVEGSDVTERILAQRALARLQDGLARSEEQLRLAAEAAEVALWDVDLQTRTLFWPARVKAMFGISAQAPATFADFQSGLHPQDRPLAKAAFEAAVDPRRRSLYDVEFRAVGKEDGRVRWIAAKGRGVFDGRGRCVRVLGTAMDITPRKAAEQALRDADRRKDEFMATLGHELRTPLAALRNALALLQRGAADPAAARLAGAMQRQLHQLTRLADDLLDVGRVRLGKLRLRREPLLLEPVLRQAVEACAPAVDGAGQRLSLRLPGAPLPVDGDPVRLTQLFSNLVGNASKFTPQGGRIEVSARLDGDSAVVSVRDSGIGIAAGALGSIFDAFTQLDGAAAHAGLGIGLALARQIAELHGGTIEARSAGPGEGSEFVVKLPLKREAAGETAGQTQARLPPGRAVAP